jgi:RNA polymerase sigma-70 factor, ECF subfamily
VGTKGSLSRPEMVRRQLGWEGIIEPDMPPDERTLLAGIAAGDSDALQRLYALYRARLWSYLYHQLGTDSGWTEELTQDVFLAVWKSASGYRGDARVATWIFRIAHNLAANARRDQTRRIQGEPLEAADTGDAAACDLPSVRSAEDVVLDRLTLGQALEALSPSHREVLDLAFAQGFTASDIAHILGIPIGTVKSRISYARRALQMHLTAEQREQEQRGER